ncbi:ras association domain-containing protein 1 isoform X1 [Hippocampus comes]|uniref:ras association domain-containing protein 1 isoform X1 n=1 Tax=Hippocampus comes TaxID=109280 RepID=UPI00094EDD21|nr:PREDICTED: ras association domain-containing protein 3 isoform X1 [Hippocampus comes]
MKVIHHGARKNVPAADLLRLPGLDAHRTAPAPPEDTSSPPPGARLRLPKGNKGAMVKVVRRHLSPQPPRLESLEAAWSGRAPRSPELGGGEREEGHAGRPPRSRKKGFKPPDVRTIFTPGERDPRVKEESGEGHSFGAGGEGTWCDVCCKYIFQKGLTCAGCKYACHAACRSRVSLDCHPAAAAVPLATSPVTQDRINNNHDDHAPPWHDVDKESKLRTEFSREEIRQKIEEYNTLTRDHLKMTLASSGVYTGFIKVQMDLRRPVTVRAGRRAPAAGSGDAAAGASEAFYLPRGVSNTLHISSHNTVRQVIVALLNKFTVADNPAKYALYKRYRREEQVYVCKLSDGEQPLFLRLVAGPDDDTLGFVLREQQTGEVLWDAFSIPELRNFLRILDKEEDEQKEALLRRYNLYRHRLKEALREVRGGTP